MKNLDLWEVSQKKIDLDVSQNFSICYNHDEVGCGELYICSYNLTISKFDKNGEIKWKKDLPHQCNHPVNISFLVLPKTICLGLENGELYTVSDCGDVTNLVGIFDDGLLAMEWSPDQELLVLVTKQMKSILMSCTFDPIHEENLLSEEFGEKQFITVGWGKKETQFHGSEGKQAAKVKNEVKSDPYITSDGRIKITWRGDGSLYAVGYLMDGIRRFKVFDREGNLQYTSEKQQGLESNLSWSPKGNVIATTQKLQNKYVVAFFEKNGLKHREFNIPDAKTTQVEDIAWSSDSHILALNCKDIEMDCQKVLLFTTSNYHWYLKQTLTFKSNQKISKIFWDNDFDVINNKKLHIVLNDGQHFSYSWIWDIDHSKGTCNDDDAIVAVIDGKKILITGFRQSVVPPPMAAFEVELESFINSIHFAPDKLYDYDFDPNIFFVITTDCKLVFFEEIQKFPLQYKEMQTIKIDEYDFPFQLYNWHWLNNSTVICSALIDGEYKLLQYVIDKDKIVRRSVESLPEQVTRIQSHPTDKSTSFLQLVNGDIVKCNADGSLEPQDYSFNIPCHKFNVMYMDNNLYFIGLSHKGNLYLNDKMVINNVSSFYVHTHFLLITTLQHYLFCTALTTSGLSAITDHQINDSVLLYKRKIERGARLVIAVPNDTRTVFQMPRGNLETIQPRPLSLKIIGEYLDCQKYYEAFDLMRKQRINLNLIYDHNPEKFLSDLDMFFDEIKNNTWLSLFLSDLENVDVTQNMYSSMYPDRKEQKEEINETKIQKVCDIFRDHILKRSDCDNKVLPLLTSYVKKNTAEDLEMALTQIKELKSQESEGSKLPVGSDEALKYLLYMVDVNQLFNVALGMYDFDLVLLVANKSQKDPKEYIPMLNELNDMEENYKKFTINKHLKRYDKAVDCLAKCGPSRYDELRTFVKYHSLYREALRLFSTHDEIYKEISDDYGLYLSLKKHYTEAGIIYERAGNIDKAIDCYKNALEWELAIKLGNVWPKEQFMELCWDLVKDLKEDKQHKEALIILDQFIQDNEKTIHYAIENSQYRTALRLCSQYNKMKLKDDNLLPALMEEYMNLKELIKTNFCTFVKHRDRLQLVRVNKNRNPVELHDPSYTNKDSDLYSDAGSTIASSGSRSSSRTYRSSKNRRKHERKVASLKEGSQYEDVALVLALHSLITSSFEFRLQAKEINVALMSFGKDKDAFELQTSLDKLLKEMKDSLKDIWTNEFVLEATNASIAAQNVPEGYSVMPQGIASLEPHIRIAPIIQDLNWKLDGL